MKIMTLLAVLAILCVCCLSVDPPTYNFSYHITFDETFTSENKTFEVNGQTYYDPLNNRQRWDRVNGRYDPFCGTIIPNVSTPCI